MANVQIIHAITGLIQDMITNCWNNFIVMKLYKLTTQRFHIYELEYNYYIAGSACLRLQLGGRM